MITTARAPSISPIAPIASQFMTDLALTPNATYADAGVRINRIEDVWREAYFVPEIHFVLDTDSFANRISHLVLKLRT